MIFNLSGGGAGAKLNVVAYASEFPVSAKENTIGIITNEAITKYIVSADEPQEGVIEGYVWIRTGAQSPTPIPVNAQKNVFIYPIGAYQYVSGAWVYIDSDSAKCYQDGAWHPWRKYIYKDGDLCGFTWTNGTSGLEFLEDRIRYRQQYAARAGTDVSADVPAYSRLYVDFNMPGSVNNVVVGLTPTQSDTEGGAPAGPNAAITYGHTRAYADISAVNEPRYFKIYGPTSSIHWEITRIWLEG